MASYTQAALVAQQAANAAAPVAPVPVAEKIPPAMARFIDVEAEIPVTSVQVDGLVVTRILKHARDSTGVAQGILLGLDLEGTLEVSNSFALPASSFSSADSDDVSKGAKYEQSVLRILKDTQFDDSLVGFYISANAGTFMRQSWVSMLATRYDTLRQGGIALVHDASLAARGTTSLRAFRLRKGFLDAYKLNKFTSQSLLEHGITFATVFDELPLKIRTSPLLSAFLASLSAPSQSTSTSLTTPSFSHISPAPSTTASASLPSTLQNLLETLEASRTEEANLSFHARQITRERLRIEAQLAKRREENAVRAMQGLAPLPEDAERLMRSLPGEPARLESTLLMGQVEGVAKSLEGAGSAGVVGLYASLA